MVQNVSNAVMQRRVEAHDSLDDFPTPPWATRALCRFICEYDESDTPLGYLVAREPAANRGHMVKVLREYFGAVDASDVHDYGHGFEIRDYLFGDNPDMVDWTITNPPFRLAGQFIERALATSRRGVAMIVRTAFLEGRERYEELFSRHPPAYVLPLVDRCGIFKGRVVKVGAPDPFNLDENGVPKKAATATSYTWIVWVPGHVDTRLRWLPGRADLERPGDYPAYDEEWAKLASKDVLL